MSATDNKIYLDKVGYDQYLKEIDDLRAKLNENGKSLGQAYSSAVGDGWHDNFDYEDSMRRERVISDYLREKIANKKNIVVVEKHHKAKYVDLDDTIKLKLIFNSCDQEELIVKLTGGAVGSMEDDETITLNSPLGRAIYNKKINSVTSYRVNDKEVKVEILEKVIDNNS